jgi:hypothetical protein
MLRSLVSIARGGEAETEVALLSLGEYAPHMTAPHRMDLMVSAMTKNGVWHCNQKCLHCYAAGQPMGEMAELSTKEWKTVRDKVIVRDCGCDLAIFDREIQGRILVHHMNPILTRDIVNRTEFLLNPEYLICTSKNTHAAIHYGDSELLITMPIERSRNDTCPWRR